MNRLTIRSWVSLASILVIGPILAACDQQMATSSAAPSLETHTLNPASGKTGAPISIEYSLPNKIDVGQTVEIELNLISTTKAGKMAVNLNVDSSLILLGNSSFEEALNSNKLGYTKLTRTIRVETSKAGLHYLNIIANEFDANGKPLMSRAFAIPLQVGDIKAKQAMPTLGKKSKSGDEEIIEMVPD